ncbi:hypothetical protein KAR91_84140, partial [Candidatus Pacearchaeota archaeon]|nr:hypothetical protein [Candidatus Pacearchaeota archaeon]
KPPTNSFTFNIEHSGLTFRWQDTLMDDEKTNSYRPDSAIYSYALYHATAVNLNYGVNTDSGVIRHEYETTKASHLYRPTVIDDAGWKEWATIFIDTAADTVNWTIPDSFWETAQYPVVLGPTFGNTSIGATNGNSGGVQRAFWVETGGSASGYTLDSVGIYISAISTDIGIIFGLYDWDYFTDTTVGVCFAGSGSKSGVYWTGGTDVLVNGVDEGGWFSSTDVLENSSGSPYDLSNSTGYYLVILTDATTNQMTLKYDAGGHSYEWWDGANTRDDDNFDTLLATCLSTCNSTIGSSPGSRQYSIYGVHGPYATGKAQIIMIMGHYGEVERFRPYGEPFKP